MFNFTILFSLMSILKKKSGVHQLLFLLVLKNVVDDLLKWLFEGLNCFNLTFLCLLTFSLRNLILKFQKCIFFYCFVDKKTARNKLIKTIISIEQKNIIYAQKNK